MTAPTALQHSYTPRGVLAELFRRREPEVLVAGPAGTGKSMACLEKMHLAALRCPGMRGLIVRKTLTSLGSTALVTFRERVIPEALRTGVVHFYGGSQQEAAQYRYRNGSCIVVGGMDRAIRIMSSEYDLIYVQEATELVEDDWEALTTRLRHGVMRTQQLIADCNPAQPTHWLCRRVERGATVQLESRHEDNPTLFDEKRVITPFGADYMAKLDALTGVRRLRLRLGIWAAAEGLVYEEFDPAVHLIDRFDIPADWPRFWSVDFGYTNPFVLQWWAEDPDGRLYLYREIYRTKTLVEDHARLAVELSRGEPAPGAVICDHDAEDRATFERHAQLGTVPAHKSVSDGLQATGARMRPAGDGRARIFLMRDSVVERDQDLLDRRLPTCTAEELPGYVWDTTAGKRPKEAPLKQDDHGNDAMRYIVAERDLASRPSIRWM